MRFVKPSKPEGSVRLRLEPSRDRIAVSRAHRREHRRGPEAKPWDDWWVVPDVAIGCDGPVDSVLLVAETPPDLGHPLPRVARVRDEVGVVRFREQVRQVDAGVADVLTLVLGGVADHDDRHVGARRPGDHQSLEAAKHG